jgi:hypothetical protein
MFLDQQGLILCEVNRLNKSIKIFINYVLAPLLFAWLVYSVYKAILTQPDLPQYLAILYKQIDAHALFLLICLLLLMLLQWLFEAKKWQNFLSRDIQLTLLASLKMIFTGISFSLATPNRIGEFVGRILHLPAELRVQATGYTFIGNFAQLVATSLAGSFGLMFYVTGSNEIGITSFNGLITLLSYLAPVFTLLVLFIYFKAVVFFSWVAGINWLGSWKNKFMQLTSLSNATLFHVFLWSLLRYIVFVIQYWLIFNIIGLDLDLFPTFIGVSMMLFLLSILPTISLVELGLRWQISILVFAPFTTNAFGLTMATTLIWLLNLVIPAAMGAFLMLGKKRAYHL